MYIMLIYLCMKRGLESLLETVLQDSLAVKEYGTKKNNHRDPNDNAKGQFATGF